MLIQARMLGVKKNPIVEVIIRDYLKDLELKNYVHIARKLKVPLREVEIGGIIDQQNGSKTGQHLFRRKNSSRLFPMFMLSNPEMNIK